MNAGPRQKYKIAGRRGMRLANHSLTRRIACQYPKDNQFFQQEESIVEFSRRSFLQLGTGAVATGAAVAIPGVAHAAYPDTSRTNLPYPRKHLGMAKRVTEHKPMAFSYPDAASPCLAIRTGTPVQTGVGPDRDIVAYSILCAHMGCPLAFDSETKVFKCGCHYSMYDAEKEGQMICGQATENLPRINLEYDSKTGDIIAVGVEGLIYGRQANVL